MFNLIFKIFLFYLLFTFSSFAKNYNNVIISGNERISNETILIFAEINDETFLNENTINIILKKIYESGFFKDVSIKIDNKNIIIDVIENPIIQTVFIQGIKKSKTEESLNKILFLKDRSSFNLTLVKKDEINILNSLKNLGYYFSTVTSSIQDLGNNKVDLFYKIDLGKKAKISKISFIGDKIFKDNTLRNIIVSEEYKFWKIISGKKYLNENLVNYDKRLLNNFYKNKGFYKVIIESSFANYLGDNEFELIFNISSGKKYYFNELKLKLPQDYDQANFIGLTSLFETLKNEHYSLNSLDMILAEIDKIVLNKQYEFLKSTVEEQVNKNLINLTFNIEDSEKFYVEKINIFGNNVTREDVVRNNLMVDEGDAFNELLHAKTLNNLKSLNFFSKVDSKIFKGSSDNQKIINFTVVEKPTGEISAGAGVGTGGGTIAFGVSENNFLGRGIELISDLTLSEEAIKGLLSFNNPNYKGSNKSLNASLESSVTDRLTGFGYKSNKLGFSLGSGFELYEDLYFVAGISSYVEKLETLSTASASIKKQEGSYFDTLLNYTLSFDKRNQKYKPSDGFLSKFSQNVPLISDSHTLTNSYDYKIYNEWFEESVASLGFYAKATNALSNKNVKLSSRVFLPSSKLRGFERGKVGPKDGNDFIGGNYAMAVNVATTLPQILPNLENTNFSIFFDAANVWGIDYSSTISDQSKIRSSVGIGVDFFTAIGPLSLSLSESITKSPNDITETFRFNLGTTF
tara:strand:- start:3098 stop:5335 length:2238 start_codon:yes stop_codon:yes gene_type:complete